jgi:hypothetical protein
MATADVTATWTSRGQNQARNEKPAPITSRAASRSPRTELWIYTPFSAETDPPVTAIPAASDRPKLNWTEDITDLAFTSATIAVEWPLGTLVLTDTQTEQRPIGGGGQDPPPAPARNGGAGGP